MFSVWLGGIASGSCIVGCAFSFNRKTDRRAFYGWFVVGFIISLAATSGAKFDYGRVLSVARTCSPMEPIE